ncbi:MAG: hypothetical protein ACJAW4_003766, partial [Paracoccaceae bacterium]
PVHTTMLAKARHMAKGGGALPRSADLPRSGCQMLE